MESLIRSGAARLGVSLTPQQVDVLAEFVVLLEKWNRAYNLTAVRDAREMVSRHILDSLAVVPYIKGSKILDVGTGAGLPGIPLAIARPDWHFTLLDCNRKKTRFVTQAKIELKLENVDIIEARIETLDAGVTFDTVVSRAVSSLKRFIDVSLPVCGSRGRMLIMKGKAPLSEVGELGLADVAVVEHLHIPGLVAQRCVVVLERSALKSERR